MPRAGDVQRSALRPFVLSLPSDRPLTPGQRSAVAVFNQSVASESRQLEALVAPIGEIISMIEGELER